MTVSLFFDEDHLHVTWPDLTVSAYPWVWLRDQSHDETTLHPLTRQRHLRPRHLDPSIRAVEVELLSAPSDDERTVRIIWNNGDPPSLLPLTFLSRYSQPIEPSARLSIDPVLWDAASLGHAPSTPYERIMDTNDGPLEWLTQVATHGFSIATGTPPTAAATIALLQRIGYIRETIFGGFWEFTADLSKADTAYTDLELAPHTDGTYSHDAPGLQLLHCLEFDGEGGLSTVVDGFRIAETLRSVAPEHYETLRTVHVPGHYLGDGSHLVAARPIIRHDHLGRLVQVSYNHADRAPFRLPDTEMRRFYAALDAFDRLVDDPALQWRHRLAPGEALLFDNWRVLHGRTAYTGSRSMCGAYLNHEDFESRLRRSDEQTTG
jgi:trimethyllysine dioxygenase